MNETENVSRRQFLADGVSIILGGVLGGLAGRVSAETELKNAQESAPVSAPEKEWDSLPLDVLSGVVLITDSNSERFGGALLKKDGCLTQYVHVVPGLELRLSHVTENGTLVSWVGFDSSLRPVTVLAADRQEDEDRETQTDAETDIVLTIPEGLAFLRGSCIDSGTRPEVRVKSLAEYALRCGLSRPDLSTYSEITDVTLYPYSRRDEDGRFDEKKKAYPAMGDVFFTPIGTDIIVTVKNANITPFLHCGENWINMNERTPFSRCCGFGYAWYHCKTTAECNWLGACYEVAGGCAGILTPEEFLAADPHLYVRFPGRAGLSREASRIRTIEIGENHKRHFTVVHVTDTHGDIDSTHAAYEYADHIKADFVALTGDYVPFIPKHGFDALQSIIRKAKSPTVITIGNHDVKEYSDQEVYETNIAPIKDILQASDEHPYYYRDFQYEGESIRVISLYPFYEKGFWRNAGYYSEEQLQWLCESMALVPDGGHIMILRHFFHHKPIPRDYIHMMFYDYTDSMTETDIDVWLNMNDDPVTAIVDAYNRRENIFAQYTGNLVDNNTETVTVDYDFSSRPASEFVAYFTGHVHIDAIGYTRGTKTRQAVLSSLCTTGAKGSEDYYYYGNTPSARDYGTDSQIAFNVFTFDFKKKSIYIARVGNGIYDSKEKTWMELPY